MSGEEMMLQAMASAEIEKTIYDLQNQEQGDGLQLHPVEEQIEFDELIGILMPTVAAVSAPTPQKKIKEEEEEVIIEEGEIVESKEEEEQVKQRQGVQARPLTNQEREDAKRFKSSKRPHSKTSDSRQRVEMERIPKEHRGELGAEDMRQYISCCRNYVSLKQIFYILSLLFLLLQNDKGYLFEDVILHIIQGK